MLVAAPAPAREPQSPARLIAPLFTPGQGTRAVLLIEDGKVVAKRYAPGFSDANRFISWSMAKTITGFLIGMLVHDGKLRLDAPAPIAEWHRPGDPRAAITLRELLQMRSGLQHIEVGDPIELPMHCICHEGAPEPHRAGQLADRSHWPRPAQPQCCGHDGPPSPAEGQGRSHGRSSGGQPPR